ncbi:M28 family peptidase [bacterium]|nr:MAG: M28 family peptidase [bacterium]
MIRTILIPIVICFCFFNLGNAQDNAEATDSDIEVNLIKGVKPERMIDEIRDFASPAFEGRELGTIGNQKATNWIKFKFQEIGLVPLTNYDSFEHEFTIKNYELGRQNFIHFGESKFSFQSPKISPSIWGKATTVHGAIVLASSSDLFQKIALVDIDTSFGFDENTFTKLYNQSKDVYKKGAIGIVLVWNSNYKDGVNLYRFEDFVEIPLLSEKNITNTSQPFLNIESIPIPILFANKEVGDQLKTFIDKPIEISSDFTVKQTTAASNIIGMIPGESNRLDKATVFVGALDQEGANSFNGTPYLGANTNASAIVSLLEISRVLLEFQKKPKYPIVIIAINGSRRNSSGLNHLKTLPEYSLIKSNPWIQLESLGYTTAEEDLTHAIVHVESPAFSLKKLPFSVVKRPKIEATIDTTYSGNPFDARHFYSLSGDKSPYSNRVIDAQNKINFVTLYRLTQVALDLGWRINHSEY